MLKKFSSLLNSKKSLASVHLDAENIRIAKVDLYQGQANIRELHNLPLQPGVFYNWLDGDGDELAHALARAAMEYGIEGEQVVTALPGDKVIIRHVQMPAMPAGEMAKALEWEAKKFVPDSLGDVVIRHVTLRETLVGDIKRVNLLLAVCSRQLLLKYYKTYQDAGICIKALDLQPLAIWKVFNEKPWNPFPEGTIAAVYEGINYCHLVLIRQGKILYTRGFPPSGLVVELRRSLEFYKKQAQETIIDSLIFSGQTDSVLKIKEDLAEQVKVPIETFNFFKPDFVVAVGLALRGAV